MSLILCFVLDQNFNIALGEEEKTGHSLSSSVQTTQINSLHLHKSSKHIAMVSTSISDVHRILLRRSFLQDDWDLIYNLSELSLVKVLELFSVSVVNILHKNLSIPVTAKFRVFPTVQKTVEYAKMLEQAGAQILTCHGRAREQRGHRSVFLAET
jgi:hypothetical protein